MSNTKPRIAIVGLGLIGSSLGLALTQADVASAIVGHDKDAGASKQAKKLGAVERTEWNLVNACEESDLIILAIPLSGIEETLKAIGPYLKQGCVVVDMASLKVPVLQWAEEILPDGVHFVGMNPIVAGSSAEAVGVDAARADLFQNRLFCLVPSPKAHPDVVQLAANLTSVVEAKPLFMDAAEHDGLMGAVDQLPAVLSLALLETAVRQPSWRELRKVAGAAFETGTNLSSNDPEAYSELFLANRDNVVRWIDELSKSLAVVRQAMLEDDSESLADRFEPLMVERNRWLLDRSEGRWEKDAGVEMPEKPNLLVDTFLGSAFRKRGKKES